MSKTASLDIIDFIQSTFGLSFSHPHCGCEIYPVQKFLLKLIHNEPLDDTVRDIQVPKDEDCIGSKNSDDYYHLSEQDYLNFLLAEDRISLPDSKDLFQVNFVGGRRTGKTTLIHFLCLYEIFCFLETLPYNDSYLDQGNQSPFQVSVMHHNQSMALQKAKEVRRYSKKCDFLTEKETRQTRETQYFKHPLINTTHEECARLSYHSLDPSRIRGMRIHRLFMDEAGMMTKSDYQAIVPQVQHAHDKNHGMIYLFVSPVLGHQSEFFKEVFEEAENDDAQLAVQIPTWEVNYSDDMRSQIAEAKKNMSSEEFKVEYGGQFAS